MLKTKMRADYVGTTMCAGRFSSVATIRDSDVFAARFSRRVRPDPCPAHHEYTVRQIVLVSDVPPAPASVRSAWRKPTTLRKQFTDCEAGVQTARGMRETVVRDPVIRTSADMSAPVRKIMDETPVGQLTAPEVTRAGIEMIAICNRREVVGESAQKREVRADLENKQFEAVSRKLLDERANPP